MGRLTFARQHGKFVAYDVANNYHVELTEVDLARMAHEISGLLYIARLCDGVIPVRVDADDLRARSDESLAPGEGTSN